MTRITNGMLVSNYMTNTNRNLNNMQKLQNQLSSGKEISKVSDDPYKASRAMQLYTEINANKQYNENIKDVTNWLDTTDTALNQISNVFSRMRELMVTAGNGAYGADEKKAIQDEIKELNNQLCQILNTNFDGAYIFGGTKSTSKPLIVDASGNIKYANKDGNPIDVYLNAAGEVVNEPTTNNKELGKDDKLYLDANGQITTSSTDEKGNSNTAIISSESLYMNSEGKITTDVNGKSIALIDNLYVDAKNNITTQAKTENKLMDTSNTLYYVTPDGYVTTQKRSEGSPIDNQPISTDDPIYRTADGKIKAKTATINTISPGDKMINWGDALYENLNGDIVADKETINKKFNSSDQLYLNKNGEITNQATYKDANGTIVNNAILPNNTELYVDLNGTITTKVDGNKAVVLSDTLYFDVDGNVNALKYKETMPTDGTKINSGSKLFIDENGKITSNDGIEKDSEGNIIKQNTPMILSDKLYLDKDKNITISSTSPNTLIKTGEALYVDADGNVTTKVTDNGPLSSDIALYRDSEGNVTTQKTTNGINNTLLNRGDSLYTDVNGNVTTLETSKNNEIPADKEIYIDSNKNLTFDKVEQNKSLSLDDIRELRNELNNTETTEDRKSQIDKILKNSDVAQLLQIDGDLKVEVSQGVFIDYNVNAVDIMEFTDIKSGEKVNLVDTINLIISNLSEDGDVSKITNEGLKKVDAIISNILENRSKVGAMTNRMESAEAKNEQENLNMTDILSKTEDIDFTEKMMEYSVMQTVYMASLQTSAKILPSTILNYL